MKNKFLLLSVIFLLLPSFIAYADVREVDCWDYYKFYESEYQVTSFQTDGNVFVPGDMIFYSGNFKNSSDSFLPETKLMIQAWYIDDGIEYMLDQSILDLGMVKKGETKELDGAYILPTGAPGGKYFLEAFVLQKNYYLSGTGFLRGFPAARVGFTVNSDENLFYLKGDKILYDQTLIDLHSPVTNRIFSPSENANFRAYIQNDSATNIDLNIKKELFYWDGLEEFKIRDVDIKDQKLLANQELEIETDLGELEAGTYVLRITVGGNNTKSILNIRFLVYGHKSRIWYSNIVDYPIKKGDNTAIVCLGNMTATSDSPFFVDSDEEIINDYKPESVEIAISTLDGQEKIKINENIKISPDEIKGYLVSFSSEEDLRDFNLTVNLSQKDFNTESINYESKNIQFDEVFDEYLDTEKEETNNIIIIIISATLSLLVLISLIIWNKKRI